MKFSTEAIVALVLAIVFALVSFGAVVREQAQSVSRSQHDTYIAASNVAPNSADVLGVY